MTDHASLLRHISADAYIRAQINALAEAEFKRLDMAGYPPPVASNEYVRDPKRVPGPKRKPHPWMTGVAPEDAEMGFRILVPTLDIAIVLGWEEKSEAKALALAGRVAGLYGHHVRHAAADIRACGPTEAARAWAPYMHRADAKCVGYLYSARADEHPSIVKIGFSTRVNDRLKELSHRVCSPVRLITCIPATQLHEYAIHQCLGRRRIGSEWYPRAVVPDWLLQPVLRVVA